MPLPLRTAPVWWRLLVGCALVLGWWSGALAQTLELAPPEPVAGEDVTVSGRGLPPGGQATARLTAPGGRVSRQSAQIGDAGRFSMAIPIPTGGRYQLYVRGPGVERTWELSVPRPAPPPPDESAAPPGEPLGPNPASLQREDIKPDRRGGQSLTPAPTDAESIAEPATNSGAAPQVIRSGNDLLGTRGETTIWTLNFAEGSGLTTQPLQLDTPPRLYAGHGSSVLQLEPDTGAVLERWPVSGPVERLEQLDPETVAVTVRHSDTLSERFTLRDGALREPVRFGTDPRTFGYLRAEADVPDPAARLEQDLTNPWLHLRLALAATDADEARAAFAEAVRRGETFYDLAGIAVVLEAEDERDLAARAFNRALQDFAAKGYDPRLLTDEGLEAAYSFPLVPLQNALAAGDDLSAGFWAERLVLAAPSVPGAGAALAAYAELAERIGTPDAAEWRERAASVAGFSAANPVSLLARTGWGLASALLAAFTALHLTLLAKYLYARRADRSGGRAPWLFALRYDSLSEKLVLLAVLAGVLVCAALASWAGGRGPLPSRILGSGTLANRTAQAYLEGAAFTGSVGSFVEGTARLVAGDRADGAALLQNAGSYAPALNNLGVLTNDPNLFGRALELEPDLKAARYNTGDTAALPFSAAYQPGTPALELPTPADLQNALSGTPEGALSDLVRNPQAVFQGAPPFGLNLLVWRGLQLLFLVVALVHLVFLFVPRPRSVYDAPRPWGYTLLALLFPGTGLADEAWGVFLLVPWAVAGSAALSQAFGWGLFPTLEPLPLILVLAGLYALNTVAVVVEGMSQRSRERAADPGVPRRA